MQTGLVVGLTAGIIVAIAMAGVSLVMVYDIDSTVKTLVGHEAAEHTEVGAPGIAKTSFTYLHRS